MNEPSRVIVWCPERKNGCEFFMTASKVAHEDTFTIKKCHMDHSCGACGESTKVTAEWVAEAMEDTVRSNVKADVNSPSMTSPGSISPFDYRVSLAAGGLRRVGMGGLTAVSLKWWAL